MLARILSCASKKKLQRLERIVICDWLREEGTVLKTALPRKLKFVCSLIPGSLSGSSQVSGESLGTSSLATKHGPCLKLYLGMV